MDVFTKSIRKLMGWCPNAKTIETQNVIHPEYFEANNQSRGKDAANSPLPSGWWNRRHNRTLMVSSGLTLVSLLGIGFFGVHLRDESFIFGLIIGTIFNLPLCIWNWHFLNKIKNSSKRVQTKNKLIVISGLLGLTTLLTQSSLVGWRVVLAFISGFCLTTFLYYLTDVYWEKKNEKIVLLEGSYMPDIYIVNA
ncbi:MULTISPECIES: DUF1673 domain-containing protein [Methanosarcina]|uniref:DUF1673 domain-containing protein n=1 Tax=Methanosarcina vacuolata Z-761 TaxID=1434123 RepID=A0A0E3Q2K0_9EURY|nr:MULTISPECIES: DUF1673 domain-containing protein [Methanosarcina]AKB42385.1 hypothetical protein MSVAZ_0116 [Methanosarcina vacuolata Z-761]AKB45889.1 hypothetical protein MSKOL_0112 [Methanosarcina sp. Kolksee]